MEPGTIAAIASGLGSAGSKFSDLAKVFFKQLDQEESRIRLFLRQLYKKPLAWILTMLTAPLIMVWVMFEISKKLLEKKNFIKSIMILILFFGICVAGIAAWLAGGYLGTFSGFFIIKNMLGYISAIGFLFGTTLSVILTIIFQIIVFNLMCFGFLKIGKEPIIQTVCDEFSIET